MTITWPDCPILARSPVLVHEFGFVEPGGLNAVAQVARSGGNPPDQIGGQRICRLALSPDTAAQLAQQLNQLLKGAAAARAKEQQKAASA